MIHTDLLTAFLTDMVVSFVNADKRTVFFSSRVDSWELATVFLSIRVNDMQIKHYVELCWNSRTVSVRAYRYGDGARQLRWICTVCLPKSCSFSGLFDVHLEGKAAGLLVISAQGTVLLY